MKIRVTIEIDAPDTIPGYGDTLMAVHATLCDALGEFRRPRYNPEEYVLKRYPPSDNYLWLDRDEKVAQVRARVKLSEDLAQAIKVANSDTPFRMLGDL